MSKLRLTLLPAVALWMVLAPPAPALVNVSTLETSGGARGLALAGDLLYVADDTAGLRVVDVSDPAAPVEIGSIETIGDAEDVDVAGTLAAVTDRNFGLRIVDVADPTRPAARGALAMPGITQGVTIAGDTAYVAADDGGLRIVDLSDPDAPVEVGVADLHGARRTTLVGDLAYVAVAPDGTRILDVSDPALPAVIGLLPTGFPYDVQVVGDLAYVADLVDGVVIFDVSDPTQPVELGRTPFPPFDLAPVRIQVAGDLAYVASDLFGMVVFDVSDPAAPRERGSLFPGGIWDLVVSGGLAYVAHEPDFGFRPGARMDIVDLASPDRPATTRLAAAASRVQDLRVAGGRLYAADQGFGLRIFDVADRAAPAALGELELAAPLRVDVAGDVAFLAPLFSPELFVVDVSNPAEPALLTALALPFRVLDLDASGDLLFLGTDDLVILDVSDPAQPVEVGRFDVEIAGSVDLQGDVAAVASFPDQVHLVDVSDPTAPTVLGLVDEVMFPEVVTLAGDLLYIGHVDGGILVYDVSNPSLPVKVGSFATRGVSDIDAQGARVVVTHNGGARVFDLSDPSAPVELGGTVSFVRPALVHRLLYTFFRSELRIVDFGPEYFPPLSAAIDIFPGSPINAVDPRRRKPIAVALLGGGALSVAEVDPTTLRFGPADATPGPGRGGRPANARLRDLDGDGREDLLLHFAADATGLAPGDDEACLSGEAAGVPFEGCDSVLVLGACGLGYELGPLLALLLAGRRRGGRS